MVCIQPILWSDKSFNINLHVPKPICMHSIHVVWFRISYSHTKWHQHFRCANWRTEVWSEKMFFYLFIFCKIYLTRKLSKRVYSFVCFDLFFFLEHNWHFLDQHFKVTRESGTIFYECTKKTQHRWFSHDKWKQFIFIELFFISPEFSSLVINSSRDWYWHSLLGLISPPKNILHFVFNILPSRCLLHNCTRKWKIF